MYRSKNKRWDPARAARGRPAGGFTLVEVLVALAVLVTVMTIVVSAFHATLSGWERGRRMLDGLRRGEFVVEQLAGALRSSMAFGAAKKANAYTFQVVNTGDTVPAGSLSWVTTSSAFLPPGSPLEDQPHRLAVDIEALPDGRTAFAVRAWPYLSDTNDLDLTTPGFVAPDVVGFSCQVYDYDKQVWADTWESSNALPAQVQITLYLNVETNGEPMAIQRLIEIPLGVTNLQQTVKIEMFPPPTTSRNRKSSNKAAGGAQVSGRNRPAADQAGQPNPRRERGTPGRGAGAPGQGPQAGGRRP